MFLRRSTWVLPMVLVPGLVLAAVTSDLQNLQDKVAAAEKLLAAVQAKIVAARGRHAAADGELRNTVRDVARVRQYPEGFWLMRSVLLDAPAQAELMRVMARQQGRRLVQAQAEAGQLSALYGEANQQLQAVKDVQTAYGDANGKLMDAEQAVLRRAGVQADTLSEDLQAALDSSVTVSVPKRAPVVMESGSAGGLPVAGRVERAFGAGAGAAKSGVVLHATVGAPVRATQAARVLYAGPFRHFGGLVIVKTVRGDDMLLGGLGTLAVQAGADVAAGQVIGNTGDDGRIYWEVRRGGRVVNPL